MTLRLDSEKAIQAVGVLLRHDGKRASRPRLLKLLYIADRISLDLRSGKRAKGVATPRLALASHAEGALQVQ